MTLLEALDVLIVHLGDDTPSTPKTERARVILRAALRYHERTRQMSSDTNKTIAAGLPCEDALRAPAVIDGEEARAVQAQAIDNARKEPTMPEIKIRALPTDTINAQSRMSGAVAAIAAECSPEHASRLCAAWADLSDVINSSCVAFERAEAVAAEKVESAHRLIDHQLAWTIGQIAANEGAELTVAQIADAIGEDRAAGKMWPTISKLDAFFDEADPLLDAEHPALCKLLDGSLS